MKFYFGHDILYLKSRLCVKVRFFKSRLYCIVFKLQERLERERNASVTRSRTGTAIKEPQRLDPSTTALKTRIENSSNAATIVKKPPIYSPLAPQVVTPVTNPATTIVRRVQNADGSISLVRTVAPAATQQQQPAVLRANNLTAGTKKLFVSKDGKIIGSQVVSSPNQQQPAAVNKVAIPANPLASPAAQQQKVQIVRSSDGKIQVRGLLPGQQLVQMPDGKLQIFSNQPAQQQQQQQQTTILQQQPVVNTPSRVILQPNATTTPVQQPQQQQQQQQILLSTTPTNNSPTIQLTSAPNPSPGVAPGVAPTKTVVAQQLAPGTPVPPGMTAYVSNGKTYAIPKSATTTTTLANKPATPIVPAAAPPQPVAAPVAAPVGGGKQMVEVKSLGQNTVTIRNGQMIVSGPDMDQAQAIAKQLASGQARLATLGNKQVLVSTKVAAGGATNPTNNTPANPVSAQTQPIPVQAPVTTPKKEVDEKKVQVTAQLLQTAQGPRIVLQGIQGSNLPKEDLVVIQQQVKHQLLKAQGEAKQQGKVPPTKIDIDLPPQIQAKLVPTTTATATTTPTSTTTPSSQQESPDKEFKVTPDYIQNAISNALDSKNLSPEIQQKLLAMQNKKGDDPDAKLTRGDRDWKPPSAYRKRKDGEQQQQQQQQQQQSPTLPSSPPQITLMDIEKKRQQAQTRLNQLLAKQKDQLKKDIMAKRMIFEKEVKAEIAAKVQEITNAQDDQQQQQQQQQQQHEEKRVNNINNDDDDDEGDVSVDDHDVEVNNVMMETNNVSGDLLPAAAVVNNKRKRPVSDDFRRSSSRQQQQPPSPQSSTSPLNENSSPPRKKRKSSGGSMNNSALAAGLVKKDKVYCICKTKYDPKK